MIPAALIFDVDGTLAETEEFHRAAFNDAFAALDLAAVWPDPHNGWVWDTALYARLLKTTGGKERIAAYLRDDLGLDPTGESDAIARIHAWKTQRYGELFRQGAVALRKGIPAILARARAEGVRLAVATTTSLPNIDALCLATLGRPAGDVFEVIAAGDEVAAKKPAPDVYLLALQRLGLPAAACIALEDSRNGLLAAKAAGLRCVVGPSLYTRGEDFGEADLVVETFTWEALTADLPPSDDRPG